MSIFEAVILGLVQGLTEFLPISSSGHLVLFQKFFGIDGAGVVMFDIAVHFATLLAVMVVLWKEILQILKNPIGKLPMLVLAATLPTVAIGLAFKDTFERLLQSGSTLGIEFIFTGLILWYAEGVKSREKKLEGTSYTDAVIIGIAQGVAILPAVSRSGLTLAGGLFRGLNREFAIRFSFLMSIPAILGPAMIDGYKLMKGTESAGGIDNAVLIFGMIAAAISGYIAIKFMLRIFTKASFKCFSYYVFVLGALIIIDQLFFGIVFKGWF